MKHLLHINQFDKQQIQDILTLAESYVVAPGEPIEKFNHLDGVTVATLFFEPSTRTRSSFHLATLRMGGDMVQVDVDSSSLKKGETVLDTVRTLQAMNVNVFAIRSGLGISEFIASNVNEHARIINAGEANVSHPTQGLLDLLTIKQHKQTFEGLKVAIIGDIAHSRVARSAIDGLNIMGVEDIRLVSPKALSIKAPNCTNTFIMEEGIQNADVVMVLRVQSERMDDDFHLGSYSKYYCLTNEHMQLADKNAIVMHPGPVNRDVEIESSLVDSEQSVITQQVTNGIAVRMAILELINR